MSLRRIPTTLAEQSAQALANARPLRHGLRTGECRRERRRELRQLPECTAVTVLERLQDAKTLTGDLGCRHLRRERLGDRDDLRTGGGQARAEHPRRLAGEDRLPNEPDNAVLILD